MFEIFILSDDVIENILELLAAYAPIMDILFITISYDDS